MRDFSDPTAELIAPGINGANPYRFQRPAYDPPAAKALLAETAIPKVFK